MENSQKTTEEDNKNSLSSAKPQCFAQKNQPENPEKSEKNEANGEENEKVLLIFYWN